MEKPWGSGSTFIVSELSPINILILNQVGPMPNIIPLAEGP